MRRMHKAHTEQRPKCLTCDRPSKPGFSGLCRACGDEAKKELAKCKTDSQREKKRAEMVAAGLILPKAKPGPKPRRAWSLKAAKAGI